MSTNKKIREQLHAIALSAPKTSGVYLWRDADDTVIYIGKAKSLRSRLNSYFSRSKDIKAQLLVSRARYLEYIQTKNEYDALLLENTLIKKHNPKYNINLKDGKTYPVLKLTREDFPRLYRTRIIRDDGARYFGPFPNVAAVDQFLDLVKRLFTLRQCKRLKHRSAPCLYYHIGRSSAPCCGKISKEEYAKQIEEITRMLEGDPKAAIANLQARMKAAANAQQFETAALIRNGIQALQAIRGQNIAEDMDPEARDYIAWAAQDTMVTFAVLKMRGGKLVARDLYRAQSLKNDDELLSEFLPAYYHNATEVPPSIFVATKKTTELANRWLKKSLGVRTEITAIPLAKTDFAEFETAAGTVAEPSYGYSAKQSKTIHDGQYETRHRAALAMAEFNAREDTLRRRRNRGDFSALEELQHSLNLPSLPRRIEGFDIAHLSGKYTVASLISFKNGNPDKKNYRLFKLKTLNGKIDDFASMKEAVARRYTRLLNENAELPDLIMVDGGKGQVSAAYSILQALDLNIPLVGLAKREEELFLPEQTQPIILPRRSSALRVLQRVRDETHRFANTRNRRLREKNELQLQFESLPGIGPKRAARLLKHFGTIKNMEKAPPDEINRVLYGK